MKLVLLTAVFLGLTESRTLWSTTVLPAKEIATFDNVHSVEYSTKPVMLENVKDIENCIQRQPLVTQVEKNFIKEQIKLKLKKAWTKARKTQIKLNKEKQVRLENEPSLGTKKAKTKPPKHNPKSNKSKSKEGKKVTSNRERRHADFEFHASSKSISDEPFPEEEKKGMYGNGNCKPQCTWDCHDFRCFRRCICNHIK